MNDIAADMIRINVVPGGYIVSSRKAGVAPSTYSYTDRAVARTFDELVAILRTLLAPDVHHYSERLNDLGKDTRA